MDFFLVYVLFPNWNMGFKDLCVFYIVLRYGEIKLNSMVCVALIRLHGFTNRLFYTLHEVFEIKDFFMSKLLSQAPFAKSMIKVQR